MSPDILWAVCASDCKYVFLVWPTIRMALIIHMKLCFPIKCWWLLLVWNTFCPPIYQNNADKSRKSFDFDLVCKLCKLCKLCATAALWIRTRYRRKTQQMYQISIWARNELRMYHRTTTFTFGENSSHCSAKKTTQKKKKERNITYIFQLLWYGN